MKRAAFIFFFCVMGTSALMATSVTKHYCSAEQVEVFDSHILIHTEDGTFETDALLVDQGGVYFTDDALRCISCSRPIYKPHDTRDICEHQMCR